MSTVIKRNGQEVAFDPSKIQIAIEKAMQETRLGVDVGLSADIAQRIAAQVERSQQNVHVEDLQDL
ncbi:MAG: ribonucleoside-diphosphate reductase, partial [Firmicutes bacterium]|nr:ribonucleoside-diphosphate reductase [Bacillota bacterium]